MAKLPRADLAFIETAKLASYLLDPDHEEGGPKARFLVSVGFDLAKADEVEKALLAHGAAYETTPLVTIYGVKYHVDGVLMSPTGREAHVRTVWQVDEGFEAPRFVTMRPLRVKR